VADGDQSARCLRMILITARFPRLIPSPALTLVPECAQCSDLRETAEVIGKVGFKMFLGVAANIGGWGQQDSEFSLYLDDNPLVDFVELPDELRSTPKSAGSCFMFHVSGVSDAYSHASALPVSSDEHSC